MSEQKLDYELTCEECDWFNEDKGICMNAASTMFEKQAGYPYCYGCDDWEGDEEKIQAYLKQQEEETRAIATLPETSAQLHRDVQQMGEMMVRMGQLITAMQRRMDEMEARQRAVTVSHGDVKRIQQLIRIRAQDLGQKYGVTDPETGKILRAAMKKDVLKRWGVKDLHDLPEAAREAVESAIGGWVNIRLVMERRGRT